MIWIGLYLFIGLAFAIILRLLSKEPEELFMWIVYILGWPILLLILFIAFLSEIKL